MGDIGRHADAIAIAERALAQSEAVYGVGAPSTLGAIGALLVAHTEGGDLEEALRLIDRSLAIERRLAAGGDSYNVVSDLNNRALAQQQLGRTDLAVASWDEGLVMARRALGADIPVDVVLGEQLRQSASAPEVESRSATDHFDHEPFVP